MAEAHSDEEDVFSVDRIRSLIELMKEHGLSEIDLRQDKQQIRLARGTVGPVAAVAQPVAIAAAPVGTAAPASDPSSLDAGPHIVTINAPMVGTFYSRANPNAKNFVEVGAAVQPDSVVCIIEAMKVFNEIPAEIRGKIVQILVQNEESVDFGKPLFKIDTRG